MDDAQLFAEVTRRLASWQRRRLWADALLWMPRGLLAGLVAGAAMAGLARFRPILHNREVALITLAMALLGLTGSLIALIARRQTLLQKARYFDGRFGLQERASTAVEIYSGRLDTTKTMQDKQLADTVAIVTRIDERTWLPLKVRWQDWLMLVMAATLLLLAIVLPNAQAAVLAQRQAVSAAISDEIVRLQAIERRIEDDLKLDDASRELLLAPIREAQDGLSTGQLSREEAVAILSQAEADLRELAVSDSAGAISGPLQAAGRPLLGNSQSAPLGQALAGSDLAQSAAAASRLAESIGQLTDDERQDLAQKLLETAAALAEIDPALAAGLDESAQALRSQDLERARQALHEAAAVLQERALEQALAAQAQAAADDLQTARAQVAAAGSPTESATTAGSSQSGSDGSGQGQAIQDTGSGSGESEGSGTSSLDGEGAGGPGPGGGRAETVYVPEYVDLSGQDGVEIQLPAECVANPERCGQLISESPTEFGDEQSLVPYERVFGDYRDAAFEALDGDYIPLGMKGLVRDYFSSLEP